MLDPPTNLLTQRQQSWDPRVTHGSDFDPFRVDSESQARAGEADPHRACAATRDLCRLDRRRICRAMWNLNGC